MTTKTAARSLLRGALVILSLAGFIVHARVHLIARNPAFLAPFSAGILRESIAIDILVVEENSLSARRCSIWRSPGMGWNGGKRGSPAAPPIGAAADLPARTQYLVFSWKSFLELTRNRLRLLSCRWRVLHAGTVLFFLWHGHAIRF